jgi:hypothetical protein
VERTGKNEPGRREISRAQEKNIVKIREYITQQIPNSRSVATRDKTLRTGQSRFARSGIARQLYQERRSKKRPGLEKQGFRPAETCKVSTLYLGGITYLFGEYNPAYLGDTTLPAQSFDIPSIDYKLDTFWLHVCADYAERQCNVS